MVIIKNWIDNEKTLVLEDLEVGDTFVFLSCSPAESVFLVMDNYDFIDITSGDIYNYYAYRNRSVKKVNLEITIKN